MIRDTVLKSTSWSCLGPDLLLKTKLQTMFEDARSYVGRRFRSHYWDDYHWLGWLHKQAKQTIGLCQLRFIRDPTKSGHRIRMKGRLQRQEVANAFLCFLSCIFDHKGRWYISFCMLMPCSSKFLELKCPETMVSLGSCQTSQGNTYSQLWTAPLTLLVDHFGPSDAGNHGIMQEVFCRGNENHRPRGATGRLLVSWN